MNCEFKWVLTEVPQLPRFVHGLTAIVLPELFSLASSLIWSLIRSWGNWFYPVSSPSLSHIWSIPFFCSENPAPGYAHAEQNEIIEARAQQLELWRNQLSFPGTRSTSARWCCDYLVFESAANSFSNFQFHLNVNEKYIMFKCLTDTRRILHRAGLFLCCALSWLLFTTATSKIFNQLQMIFCLPAPCRGLWEEFPRAVPAWLLQMLRVPHTLLHSSLADCRAELMP